MTDPTPVALPVGLRRAVIGAGALGQLAAASSGVLSPTLVPLTIVALVGFDQLRARAPRHRVVVGNVASGAVALAVLVAAPMLVGGGSGLRDVLGPLLLVVQLGQVLLWRTVRDVQTGLLVAFAWLLLGASFAPDLVAGVPIVLGAAACVAGVALLVQHRDPSGQQVVRVTGVAPARPVVPVAAALLVGLLLFLLVPVPEGAGLASKAGLGDRGATGAPSARAQGLSDQQQLDLSVRGRLGDRPLARVPADSPQLWRGQVFDTYDGRGWTAPPLSTRDARPPPPEGPTRTDRVEVLAPTPVLWSPGEPVSVTGARVFYDDDAIIRPYAPTRGYTLVSVPRADPGVSAAGAADPRWLQLPDRLPERVRELSARLTRDAGSTAQAVQAVESFVRDNARYDLDSPVPTPGRDAVDEFLFDDRVGFCEQFASAEVVLLRAAGIPARLATGLGYGDDAGPSRTYLERNLHAWVEVSYAGVGWVSSDPTPAAARTQDPSLRARLAGLMQRALSAVTSLPGGRLLLAGALLTVLASFVLGTRLVRRTLDRRPVPPPVDRPALAAFLRLDVRLGADARRPHESLAELRERLDLPREPFVVLEAECYGARPPSDGVVAAALLDRIVPAPPTGLRAGRRARGRPRRTSA